MIRINLLPFRAARRKENIRRQTSVFFLSFIFIGITLFYFQQVLVDKINELNKQKDTVTNRLKIERQAANEVDKIKKELEVLELKMNGIKTVKLLRREPVQLLDTMTQVVIPKRMWFTNMTANGQTIGIRGVAMDQKTVADFMTRLEATGLFSSVNLATLKHVDMQGLGLKTFEVTCDKIQLNPPDESKEKK